MNKIRMSFNIMFMVTLCVLPAACGGGGGGGGSVIIEGGDNQNDPTIDLSEVDNNSGFKILIPTP